MSMNMSNGSGAARQISSITNISQGGGDKKAGLPGTVGRPYSSVSAHKTAFRDCTLAGIMNPSLFKNVRQARPIGMMLVPVQK